MVSLRPVDDANREAVESLAVAPDQARFVSGVRESIERYGFERTGALHGDELLLRLTIA